MDDVEVIPQGGGNIVVNGSFNSNANGWFMQGTHQDSVWQATGGYSGGCLRVGRRVEVTPARTGFAPCSRRR